MLVTFLWRSTNGIQNIVIQEGGGTFLGSVLPAGPRHNRLRRLRDTDLWHKTYRLPADTRLSYSFLVGDHGAVLQPDPLNHFPWQDDLAGNRSMVSLPLAPPLPWIPVRTDIPPGVVERHIIRSDILGNERPVWVYTPPKYTSDGSPYLLLLMTDGQIDALSGRAQALLDNLLATGAIPPLVAVMVSSIDGPSRNREMADRAESLLRFLTTELLPWVQSAYHVTTAPEHTIVFGGSGGGKVAILAALRNPDIFGNVIALSASVVGSAAEPEWPIRAWVQAPLLPVRWYLRAGRRETRPLADQVMPNYLLANRHLRDVLEAKGYEVHYIEDHGAHDTIWGPQTLSDGLQTLFKPEHMRR